MPAAFVPHFRRAMRTVLPAAALTIGATLVACRTADAPELDAATAALMLPADSTIPVDDRPLVVPSDAAEMGEIPPGEAIVPVGDTVLARPDTTGHLRARLEDTLRQASALEPVVIPPARTTRR